MGRYSSSASATATAAVGTAQAVSFAQTASIAASQTSTIAISSARASLCICMAENLGHMIEFDIRPALLVEVLIVIHYRHNHKSEVDTHFLFLEVLCHLVNSTYTSL